jgi:predicted CXXCH cytochrome family protein
MRLPSAAVQSVAGIALAICLLPALLSAQKKSESWSSKSASATQIAGATRVGSDTCTTCHGQTAANFSHAYHAQQGVECEDCHGAGSLHIEGGGDVKKIVKFQARTEREANAVCLSCHGRNEKVRHWLSGSHAANHLRCTDCHQIHDRALRAANERRLSFDTATRAALLAGSVCPETSVILRPPSATNDACLKCHPTENAQLSMPYHHPLREGKMSCVDCHDPHGGAAGNNLRTGNTNQLCLGCHAQYRGPFAYQHPPVTENCMICHSAHGSPNTNLLNVSEPALCLQCHAGHHNGASLPLPDRCTNCHLSIHGTDTPTPSGGSRFVDKGPSEAALRSGDPPAAALAHSHMALSTSIPRQASSNLPAYGVGAASGALAMLSSGYFPSLSSGDMGAGSSGPAGPEEGAASSAYSLTPGAYRFIHGTGYLGRVGEYDSLEQSAGVDVNTAYVSTRDHLTLISRANVLASNDYSAASQLTVGSWLQAGFGMRSFVQQQDHYPFYAFPFLDVPPGTQTPCIPLVTCVDSTNDFIPQQSIFEVTRRLGNAYARIKVPELPVHLFVKGNWQARVGATQFGYLDENTILTTVSPCGTQCHYNSQFQQANYTTRNIAGGADVDLGPVRITWEHLFSSFNDRLIFPTATFTGDFTPESEGISINNKPPFGPYPMDIPAGNYPIGIPAPNQSSSDSLRLNWTGSPNFTFNGDVSYTRLRNLFTHYLQNSFDTNEVLTWRPLDRLRVTADYHQQNLINDFTPYYSMYGNVSYHNHWEGLRLDYKLPKGFDVETYYQHSGITRSNALWWEQTSANIYGLPSQIYSIDNTDLLHVVPSSTSNTSGLALRYHDQGHWSARAGYEWTGTHNPDYLTVPQSNNRAFADVWFTPTPKLAFSSDTSIILQNAFPAIPLLRPDGNGLSGDFQRRNRFYTETASATLRLVPGWNLGLGYSYQQNNLNTYMAFQNLPGTPGLPGFIGYVLDEPFVPYKQITQAYWGESGYNYEKRWGINFRLTYNSSRSGMRPDVNPANAGLLGNAALISAGMFDPGGLFPSSLNNLQFGATQISGVIVPQWIGESKAYYHFPNKFEGGFIFYYGSYRDYWNPILNGVLRTYTVYVGRSW